MRHRFISNISQPPNSRSERRRNHREQEHDCSRLCLGIVRRRGFEHIDLTGRIDGVNAIAKARVHDRTAVRENGPAQLRTSYVPANAASIALRAFNPKARCASRARRQARRCRPIATVSIRGCPSALASRANSSRVPFAPLIRYRSVLTRTSPGRFSMQALAGRPARRNSCHVDGAFGDQLATSRTLARRPAVPRAAR